MSKTAMRWTGTTAASLIANLNVAEARRMVILLAASSGATMIHAMMHIQSLFAVDEPCNDAYPRTWHERTVLKVQTHTFTTTLCGDILFVPAECPAALDRPQWGEGIQALCSF